MSLRNFIRRTHLLIQHGLFESRNIKHGHQRPLELTRLEERVLFSASALAPVVAQIAEAGGSLFVDSAPSADPTAFHVPDQQLLDLVADAILPSQTTDQNSSTAATEDTLELVLLDSSISNLDQMISNLKSENSADGSRTLEFVVLDSTQDGIAQITSALLNRNGVDGIHIVSQGAAGQVQLGSTLLSTSNLETYRTAISAWQYSMSDKADILFYGCDLASSDEGQQLLNEISLLTDCDAATAADVTCGAALTGDRIPDDDTAEIESAALQMPPLVSSRVDLLVSQSVVPAITVTEVSQRNEIVFVDTGIQDYEPLLADARSRAAAGVALDVVQIDSASDGMQQITDYLMQLNQPVDAIHLIGHGTDRAFKLGNTWIDLNGLQLRQSEFQQWSRVLRGDADIMFYGCNLAGSDSGLVLGAGSDGSWITGLAISGFSEAGILVQSNDTVLVGNHLWDNGTQSLKIASNASHLVLLDNLMGTRAEAYLATVSAENLTTGSHLSSTTGIDFDHPSLDQLHSTDLVLIDQQLDDAAALISAARENALVFVYNGAEQTATEILAQLGNWASNSGSGIQSLSILSHGVEGAFQLGSDWIDASNLSATHDAWRFLAGSFSDDAKIYILSCDVAGNLAGQKLVDALAELTSTSVYTSDDVTGVGGDWTLEYASSGSSSMPAEWLSNVFSLEELYAADVSLAWYGTSWQYRQSVTISSSLLDGSVDASNFVVLVDITQTALRSTANGGRVGQADGGDFVFTLSDETTKLSHQIESYDAVTGRIKAWVRVPTLSALSNTSLFLYYGNAAAADQWDDAGTWDSTYGGVWHLSNGILTDSTSSANNGFNLGSTNTTGVIEEGRAFNGSDQLILIADSNSLDEVDLITISAWIYPTINDDQRRTIVNKGNDGDANYWFGIHQSQLEFRLAGTGYDSNVNLSLNTWSHVATTFNNSTNTLRMYVNGSEIYSTTSASASPVANTELLYIGTSPLNELWQGSLDEIRFQRSVESGDEILADYRTQAHPGTYVSLASEEGAPVITSNGGGATASISIAENSTAVTTVSATDPGTPVQTLSYSISGGVDATRFSINSSSGVLTFVSAPDFESPTDTGANNVYDVIVEVSDGALTDTQAIAVSVTNVNDAPTATNLNAAESYTEDTALNLTDIVVSDVDSDSVTVTLTLSNTAAGSLNTGTSGTVTSTYNAGTGVWTASGVIADVNTLLAALTFTSATNFNSNVTIATSVSDGSLSVTGTRTMTGIAVNDAPSITSSGGGATASFNVAENTLTAITITSGDVDGGTPTYSITGGTDAAKFTINSLTGELAFVSAPNFELPSDAGGNNGYDVTVQVSDGAGGTDSQAISVTVTNTVDETILYLRGDTSPPFSGLSTTAPVASNLANFDPGFDSDAGLLIMKGGSGANETDDVKHHSWILSGPVNFASQTVQLGFWSDVKDGMNGAQTADVALGKSATVNAYLLDLPTATTESGGVVIATGSVTDSTWGDGFAWEQKVISFGTINYSVAAGRHLAVKLVVDGSSGDDLWFAYDTTTFNSQLRIGSPNTAPTITSNGAGPTASINVTEFATAVTTVTATDTDLPAQTLSYSIVAGADAAMFTIDVWTGTLAFVAAPDFEAPADVGANNVYDVTVQVSDGAGGIHMQKIAVTVTNINDAPEIADTSLNIVVAEDAGVPTGVVGSLLSSLTGGISDADSGAVDGIAITASVESNGTWYYTTSNGTSWITVGSVSSASSLLLANNASTRLYFASNSDYHGTSSSALTFRGWDQTTGTAGTYVDSSINGGTTAFSTATDVVDVSLTAVNDAPTATILASAFGVNEDDGYRPCSGISVFDPDAGSSSLTVTLNVSYGLIKLNTTIGLSFTLGANDSASMTFTGTLTDLNTALATVTYRPDPDYSGTDILTLSVNDQGHTGGGALSDVDIANIVVATINDAPVRTAGSPPAINVNEDSANATADTLGLGGLAYGPGGGSDELGQSLTYTVIAIPTHITLWKMDGITQVTASTVVTLTELQGLKYKTVADANGSGSLTWTVVDNGGTVNGGMNTLTETLSITVNAVNDAPLVTSNGGGASAVISIQENSTAVTTVTAVDGDVPAQTLTYTIAGGADAAKFTINSSTGVLMFVAAPDYEAPNDVGTDNVYDLTIQVSDGISTDTQTVSVMITDVNEFSVGSLADSNAATNSVAENSGVGTTVGITAFASDQDGTTNTVNYSLDDAASGRFTINSSTGAVTVADSTLLNREASATQDIIIRATSTDGSFSTQLFTIAINDVNEFAVGTVTDTDAAANAVNENAANGTTVGITAFATDADATTNAITYSFDVNAGGRFAINGASGVVTVADGTLLDREAAASHNIVVRATSADGSFSTQTFTVNLNPLNDNNPIITSNGAGANASISIAENSTNVTTVTAIDADLPAQTLTYSIVGGADAAKFSIQGSSGMLTFVTAPNFEAPTDVGANNVYDVIVQASDGLGGTDTQAISVKVEDLRVAIDNQNTGSTTGSGLTLSHTTSGANRLMLVSVSMANPSGRSVSGITYDGTALTFLGTQAFGSGTDESRVEMWALTAPVVGTHNVVVSLTGANIHGTIVGVTTFSGVDQTTPLGAFASAGNSSPTATVNVASGTDELVFAAMTIEAGSTNYELTPGAGQTEEWDLFRAGVNLGTGVNSGASTKAGAASVTMSWTFGATNQWALAAVSIKPTVSLNRIPTITSNGGGASASVSVSENTTAVTTMTVIDPDLPAQSLTCSIISGDDAALFTINSSTGQLAFVSAPNAEMPSDVGADNTYEVIVLVSDGNGGSATQALNVTVLDINEFAVGAVSDVDAMVDGVHENAIAGTAVGITALATDADATTNAMIYALQNNDGGRFAIDATTGIVTVAGAIDREVDGPTRNITVRATSADGSFTNQVFTIAINDLDEFDVTPIVDNDVTPEVINENLAVGTAVGITAFSQDQDGTTNAVTYAMVDDDGGRFAIDSVTGVVTVAGTIDREADGAIRNITVRATSADGSSSLQVFTISVNPVNETAPVIVSHGGGATGSHSVLENSVFVLTVTATDADLPAETLNYTIAGGADASKFTIDASSGILAFVTPPDYETPTDAGANRIYDVIVQVSDGTFTDSQILSIGVTNAEDPGFWFSTSRNATAGSQSWTNSTVVRLGDPNLTLGSGTTDGTLSQIFDLDSFTADGKTDLNGLHFVRRTVTVGTTDAVTVNAGDVLFSIDGNDTVGGIAVNDKQVVLFRPTVAGNYSSGTFSILLTIPGSTGDKVRDFALVETAMTVGGTALQVGDFLIVFSNAIYDKDISLFRPADMGTSPTSGTLTEFIDGQSAGISFGGQIRSLDLVDRDVTLGGVSLTTGTLLVSISASDSVGSNNLSTTKDDIFQLQITATGTETSAGIASRLVTGSDLGLSAGGEDFDAFSLQYTASSAPVIASDGGGLSATASIAENSTVVTTVTATDADVPVQTLTYSIIGGADAALFTIHSSSGVLSFVTPPNRETPTDVGANSIYDVVVQVSDGQMADAQAIAVTVNDVDEFNVGAVTDTDATLDAVDENVTIGTVVGITASASDADATTNTITYSLMNNDGGNFAIGANTGIVTTAALLDREALGATRHITVQATSSDGSTATQVFTIAINDLDEFDTSGVLDSNATLDSVAENAANGTIVGMTAVASDADATNNTILYSLDDNAGGRFAIDNNTGIVTVADGSLLNFEAATSHAIMVRATSADTSFTTQSFTISLTDVNESAITAISDSNFAPDNLAENAANGTPVGITAIADDADGTDTVSYSLDDTAGGRFTIDALSGIVTVADGSLLNYEVGTSHSITVRATSTDGSSSILTLVISLSDVDEFNVSAIVDSNAGVNAVTENATNGSLVGYTASAFDGDGTLNTILYSLDNSAGGRFAIDGATGVVTVANGAILDREAAAFHTIMIRAASDDGSFSTISVDISLVDVDEFDISPAADINATSNVVAELSLQGTLTGITVSASDADATTNVITYTLDDNAGGRFQIDSVTGVVTVGATVLDYEFASSHSITVRATSADSSATTLTLTINLTDVNEFSTTTMIDNNAALNEVAENALNGTIIGITAFASDGDGTDSVTYSLTNNAGGRFSIHSVSGIVTVTDGTLLDREAAVSHNIIVRATSTDSSFTTQTYTINLIDVDEFDASPITDSDFAVDAVNENAANGTVVGITANSFDSDATTNAITYTLDDNASGRFAIDGVSGIVTVANSLLLDYETSKSHSITVRATSADTSTTTQTFTINLIDQNDTPPVILPNQQFSVSELAPAGTIVGDVLATDADSVGTLQNWTIVSDNTDGIFGIVAGTVLLTVVNPALLNFEATDVYTLSIVVSDGVSTSALQTVMIRIVDQNEAPQFAAAPVLNVNENTTSGTVVGSVTASDPDAGDAVTYSILSSGPVTPFAIDAATGQIRVIDAAMLDFEALPSVTLTIQVADSLGLVDLQTVTITLNDLNEAPTGLSLSGGNVVENSAAGIVVGQFTGTDGDAGDQLSYSLVNDAGGRFLIDGLTGRLTVAPDAVLNFEATPQLPIIVQVTDLQELKFSQAFVVHVTNINEAPVAVADYLRALQLRELKVPVNGVLANDLDDDGDAVHAMIMTGPIHGTLILNSDGSLTYKPTDLFSGIDVFSYQTSDGQSVSNTVTVTIDVMTAVGSGGSNSSGNTTTSGSDTGSTASTNSGSSRTDTSDNGHDSAGAGDDTTASNVVGPAPSSNRSRGNFSSAQGPFTAEENAIEQSTGTAEDTSQIEQLLAEGVVFDMNTTSSASREKQPTSVVERAMMSLLGERSLNDPIDAVASGMLFSLDRVSHTESSRNQFVTPLLMDQIVVGSTAVVSTSLSVGYVIWILRGGSLLTAFMSAMPAWQAFDPLPVLQSFEKQDDGDDETLLSIATRRIAKSARQTQRQHSS